MRHLGDIKKLSGAAIEPVDCITGGSPCQDLSVAGKRAGLAGGRSGLFFEQIRVIKEMRSGTANVDGGPWPRYMVWENVPGALSSNRGKDFATVLEEAVRIVEPEAPSIPTPAKWPTSGCLMGGGWSIAWRVHDAQFWGVPQRRKRIALVCDFGGHTAPEILFERKGLRGDTAEGGTAREEIAGGAESGFNPAVARSLIARADGSPCADRGPNIVCSLRQGGCDGGGKGALVQTEKSGTLGTGNDQTLRAKANCAYREDTETYPVQNMVARRLTPLEWERLQGYPDGWTNIGKWIDSSGKKHRSSDNGRYKALGNSIALPFWFWLLRRISAQYERPATLGSLFDGIGGFPLCWERCNGKGTALWASEIEEFPMAVTKKRFGEG